MAPFRRPPDRDGQNLRPGPQRTCAGARPPQVQTAFRTEHPWRSPVFARRTPSRAASGPSVRVAPASSVAAGSKDLSAQEVQGVEGREPRLRHIGAVAGRVRADGQGRACLLRRPSPPPQVRSTFQPGSPGRKPRLRRMDAEPGRGGAGGQGRARLRRRSGPPVSAGSPWRRAAPDGPPPGSRRAGPRPGLASESCPSPPPRGRR